MIGRFPAPLPDELLYSVLARYARWIVPPSAAAFRRHVWGTAAPAVAVDLPGALGCLEARLPHPTTLSAEVLLTGHTLFPYYAPFMEPGEAARAARALQAKVAARGRSGLRGRPVRRLRYCPGCYEADRAAHGEAYWHRVHQLPGVFVCPSHGRALGAVPLPLDERGGARYLALEERVRERGVAEEPPPASGDVLDELAERSRALLAAEAEPPGLAVLAERYRRYARARGWTTPRGRPALEDLVHASRSRHGPALLEATGAGLARGKDSWIEGLLRASPARRAPVCHLLLLDLLDVDLASVLGPGAPGEPGREAQGRARRSRPVAAAPCRNPLCEHGAGAREPETPAPSPHRRYVRCPVCGFCYHYRAEAPGRWKILEVGSLWRREASRHLAAGGSRKALAERVGMSPGQLRHQLRRLGFPPSRRGRSRAGERAPGARERRERTRRRHRAWLRRLRRVHPEWPRSWLARADLGRYQWLRRHDAAWLERTLPPPRCFTGPPVDWAARDRALEARVPAALEAVLEGQAAPQRVTTSALARALTDRPHGLGSYRRARLPRTVAALKAAAARANAGLGERRRRWAESRFRDAGRVPTPSELARALGFRRLAEAEGALDLEAVRTAIARALEAEAAANRTSGG